MIWPFKRKKLPLYRIFKNDEGFTPAILMTNNKYGYLRVSENNFRTYPCNFKPPPFYISKPTLEEAEQVYRDYIVLQFNKELKRMAEEYHVVKEIW